MKVYVASLYSTGERWTTVVYASMDVAEERLKKGYGFHRDIHTAQTATHVYLVAPQDPSHTAVIVETDVVE